MRLHVHGIGSQMAAAASFITIPSNNALLALWQTIFPIPHAGDSKILSAKKKTC
jgi:hypothetical protein